MKTFKDSEGREWPVAVNTTTAKRVRDLCNVDLLDVASDRGALILRIAADAVLLGDVLYAMCRTKAEERGLTDEQFGEAMDGDAVEAATEALLEELVDFFRGRKRALLTKALAKANQYVDMAADKAEAFLESPETDKAVEAAVDEMLDPEKLIRGHSSTAAPESSG